VTSSLQPVCTMDGGGDAQGENSLSDSFFPVGGQEGTRILL